MGDGVWMEDFIEKIITFLSNGKINIVFETLAAILTVLLTLVGAVSGLRKYVFKRNSEKSNQAKQISHFKELLGKTELDIEKSLERIEQKPSNQKDAKIS